jgi:hypothetical protein
MRDPFKEKLLSMVKIRKLSWPIIIIIIILGMFSGFYVTTAVAFPENPSTYIYFNKIADMPHIYHEQNISVESFWQNGGDCSDRALAFKEYLESKRATDVKICRVYHIENGTFVKSANNDYGHAFIIWNGKVYNPSLDKSRRFYNYDLESYKASLKELYQYNIMYFDNQTVGTLF